MDQKFISGVVSGVIGSILAAWILFLLSRPAKAIWLWMRTPGPMTLQQKVQIAEQIGICRQSLERLNHMAANPKDLYLYLFQLGVTIFVCISGAMFVALMAPDELRHPVFRDPTRGPLLSVYFVIAALLGLLGLLFCIISIWEAKRMSVKHIDETRAKVERTIADLTAKLNMPLVTGLDASITESDSVSDQQSQSPHS